MDTDVFVFPDGLDNLTRERLQLPEIPQDWLKDAELYSGRISGIRFRKPGQMVFCLDGRKSNICYLTAEEAGWLDVGDVTPEQLACHYAAARYTRFTRNPVQKTLFD